MPRGRCPNRRRAAAATCVVGVAVLAGGCGGQQDALAPKSHQAGDIAALFWWMLGVAALGFGIVVFLLFLSWWRRDRRGVAGDNDGDKPGERFAWYVVLGGGIVVPVALLVTLFVVSDIFVMRTTESPAKGDTRLTIEVIGHQWWWEVRYPGTTAVTANEIHIPVRTPVRVEVRTADVIHSFWVPRLNRKMDAIPGRDNSLELYADTSGRYRGQCSEFCGIQHAHMGLYVFAQPAAAFRRWLAKQSAPAAPPAGARARRGEQLFTGGSCSACHTIRGTPAGGDTGPDLTHLASRTTIGALTAPLTRSTLRRWLVANQQLKPGNQMPDIALPETDIDALVRYLGGLR